MLQLLIAAEHVIASERFVEGITFALLGQFLAQSEVNQGKFDFVLFGRTGADVLRLDITMGVANRVQGLDCMQNLPEHFGGEPDPVLLIIDVLQPVLQGVSAVGHQDLAVLLAYLVAQHERQALE